MILSINSMYIYYKLKFLAFTLDADDISSLCFLRMQAAPKQFLEVA